MFKTLTGAALGLFTATASLGAPLEDTCRLAGIMGTNSADAVQDFIDSVPNLWSENVRSSAAQQLETLAGANTFAGSSVWHIADFGDDLQEYLIILRLPAGEVSYARVRYEWSPSGLALTALEIKRTYAEAMALPLAQAPFAVSCPG